MLRLLQTWPWLDTARMLRQRFREDRLGITASSLTFTTLVSLVPLVAVMLAIFTAFPMFSKFQDSLQKYFLQSLIPDTIAKPVLAALTQFAAKAYRLGTFGLVLLVITALTMMLTIDRTLNGIWRVRKPRPIGQRVLVYWAAVTLGPLLLGVSLTLTSYVMSSSRGIVSAVPGGVSVVLNIIEFMVLLLAIASLFRFVPNTYVRWRHALFGALFTGVGFELAKKGLSWYLTSVPTYTSVFGAFAVVPILLVWIYLGWVVVLLGAVVAAYAPSVQMKVVRRPAVPGLRLHLTVNILRELEKAREGREHGLSAEQLSETLRTDPLQIEPLLDTLIEIDWIGRLDEEGGARYVMLGNPADLKALPLFEKVLLDPSLELDAFRRHAHLAEIRLAELLQNSTVS